MLKWLCLVNDTLDTTKQLRHDLNILLLRDSLSCCFHHASDTLEQKKSYMHASIVI